VTQVRVWAEVQTSRAGTILVIINFVTLHLNYFANRVIHRARMAVKVVFTNTLVSQEVAIWGDRQVVLFQEAIQFIDWTLRWVTEQVLHKQNHWFDREAFLKHSDHASCQRIVQFATFPEQLLTFNGDVALTKGQDDFLRLDDVFDSFPVASFDCVKHSLVCDVGFGDRVWLIADHDSDVVALNQVWIGHSVSFRLVDELLLYIRWSCSSIVFRQD